jgi:sec-independent protein translocase protein TatC
MSAIELPAPLGPEDDVRRTLREHLLELRQRLKWALAYLALGFCAAYYWSQPIFHFLMRPILSSLPEGEKALHFSSSVEPFFIYLKVALYAGLFISAPFILWQLWTFVAPGLYRREKRAFLPFVVAGTFFFFSGAAFCYFVILPPAFGFLIGSAGPDIKPVLMMNDQLGLVTMLILAFGLIFELPLILTSLSMAGIVDHRFLARYRRHAIVVNTIVAAVITPTGDPFNLALMAVPMMLCYELGVLGARIFGRGVAVHHQRF